MTRFWVGWWATYLPSDTTVMPLSAYITGQRVDTLGLECSFCAWVEAQSENVVHRVLQEHFPNYLLRFIDRVPDDWTPGDRFPGATVHRIAA